MSECELTELPKEMCSHCRGLDKKPGKPVASYWISARYEGQCRLCREPLGEGDRIGYIADDEVWVCERCAT